MPDGTVVCRRCGVSNTAGDQFCGSCGAFLEWEGDPTDAPPADTIKAPPAEQTPPAEPPPAIASPAWRPAPTEATALGIACPACGTRNPTQKVFCQSCGMDLRDAVRAGGPVGTAPASTRKTPAEKSGGMPFWLPIVVVIGLLAGGAFVVAGIVMRPTPVPPGATTVPSVTFTPTLPPSPGTSPGESVPPATESGQLTLTGAKASSIVGNRAKFKADRVIDGNLQTAWQEGAKDTKGQWIEVSFSPSRLDYVVIYSGFQLNHDAYLGNARPENVLVSVNGGAPVAFVLADAEQPQRLDLDDTPGATTVRIEIVSSFDAVKTSYPGSPFDDLSISEIRAFGVAGG
jgi:hypothetical protein